MKHTHSVTPVFFFLFFLSIIIFFLSQLGALNLIIGLVQKVSVPVQRLVVTAAYAIYTTKPTTLQILQQENSTLLMQLAKENALEKDNQALQDQFQTQLPVPNTVLPAGIIGFAGFIPGVSPVSAFV